MEKTDAFGLNRRKEIRVMQPKTMIFKKCADTRLIRTINKFIESKYFIAVLAFLSLCSNVLGWELYVYTTVITFGVYLCLFARDMRTLAPAVAFMYVSPSMKNNPAVNEQSIFYPEHGLAMIIAYLAIFFTLLILRILLNLKNGNFFTQKRKLFWGFVWLGAAFLLGGIGQKEYTVLNLRYGALLFVSLFVLYYCLIALVDWKSVPRDYFAWTGMFLGLLVFLEIINIFLLGGVISLTGEINRTAIYTGWGINNNMACVLLFCIPCAFYMAATKRLPARFVAVGTLIYLGVVFSSSRNGIVMGTLIYIASAIASLWNHKNRKANIIAYSVIISIFCVFMFFATELMMNLFEAVLKLGFDDNGRFKIYLDGLKQFTAAPLLGKGFYACTAYRYGTTSMTFIPPRWHNTLVQMLASCGTVGVLAYVFHRFQTLKMFLKKPTLNKTFIGLCVLSLLMTSVLDCHFFNIGPGLLYSIFLAFAEKDGETKWSKPLMLGAAGYKHQGLTD